MLCKNYTGVSSISSGLIYIRMSTSPYAIEIDFENTTITGGRVIFYVTAQTPDMVTVGFRKCYIGESSCAGITILQQFAQSAVRNSDQILE